MSATSKAALQAASPYNAAITREQFLFYEVRTTAKLLHCTPAINDNLAAMIKTLYEYRFVRFEFPDENGKPYFHLMRMKNSI